MNIPTVLYSDSGSLNSAKVADLKKLLQFIPSIYHKFYSSIKADKLDKTVTEDISEDEENDVQE